jgi:hypothetical protein
MLMLVLQGINAAEVQQAHQHAADQPTVPGMLL